MNRAYRCVLAALAACGAALASAQKIDPAEWAPPEAVVFLGVTSVSDAWAAFETTGQYRLLSDPLMRELSPEWSVTMQFAERFRERLARLLDVEPEKLTNPFSGPVAAWLVRGEGDDSELGGVLMAGYSDREQMRSYYDKLLARLRQQADRVESETFAGEEIVTLTRAAQNGDEDDDFDMDGAMDEESLQALADTLLERLFSADAMPPRLTLCLTAERLVVADTAEQAKAALRQQRRDTSLKDTDDYRTLLRSFEPAGPLRALLNVRRLVEHLSSDTDTDARRALSAMGISGVRSVVFHTRFGGDTDDSRSEALVLMSGERTGLPRLLSMPNRPIAPPAFVPADTVFHMGCALSVPELIDEIERITRQVSPEAADAMRASLEQVPLPSGPLNLRKELIDHLREPVTMSVSFARPFAPDSPRVLISIGHRDRGAIDRALATLTGAMPGMMTSRDVGGAKVYDAAFGGMSLAASGDAILLGSGAAVEAALRGSASDGLAEVAGFRAAARLAPSEASMIAFVDTPRLMEAAIGMSRYRDQLGGMVMLQPMTAAAMELLTAIAGDIPAERAEDFARLIRHAAPAITTVTTTPEGLRITSVQLKPDAERSR